MYVGTLSDFFYKPKDFLLNLPKFKQKQEITYLSMNNRIFKINNITGNITLVNNSKNQNLSLNEKSSKEKPENKSRNSNIDFLMNNTSKTKETKFNDYSNRTLDNTSLKKNHKKKPKNLFKSKIKKIPILNLINATKTSDKITTPKIKSIKYVEENFKKQIFPYYNKTPKKLTKPEIFFGQKIINETIPNKKKINQLISKDKNAFLTIYRQHYNNINNEGNNNRIYFEEKNDNCIMKAFKEQILKEKLMKELKSQFKFYENKKNEAVQIPNLSLKNFEFYNGYNISDNKKERNNYQKSFFRYVNKHKFEENNANKDKILNYFDY